MTLTKKVELGINIDNKFVELIAMPEFTQDWIYTDSISSYTHKQIEGIEISVWMHVLKKNFLEEGEEVPGTTINQDVEQERLIKDGWTPPKAKKKEKK